MTTQQLTLLALSIFIFVALINVAIAKYSCKPMTAVDEMHDAMLDFKLEIEQQASPETYEFYADGIESFYQLHAKYVDANLVNRAVQELYKTLNEVTSSFYAMV